MGVSHSFSQVPKVPRGSGMRERGAACSSTGNRRVRQYLLIIDLTPPPGYRRRTVAAADPGPRTCVAAAPIASLVLDDPSYQEANSLTCGPATHNDGQPSPERRERRMRVAAPEIGGFGSTCLLLISHLLLPGGGSRPGERRGGRQKGTPNQRSLPAIKAAIAQKQPALDSLSLQRLAAAAVHAEINKLLAGGNDRSRDQRKAGPGRAGKGRA
jgi:hypothetical protein